MPRLALLAFALLLGACDSAAPDRTGVRVDALSHDADALIGTWDLATVTSPGQVGPPETVAYRGLPRGYTFRADGQVEFRDVTGAIRAEPYAVVPAGPAFPGAPPALRIGDRSESWGLDGASLYIDQRPLDGSLFEYRRR